jgi:hypothetical protein
MKLTIYRIFSFLLLPMAILFSISFLLFLRAAFSNPALFIPLFLIGCISIYSFASLNFLIRGLDGKKMLGRSAKDWLIANAIVSLVYSLLAIAQRIMLALNPETVQEIASQAKANAGDALKASDAQVMQSINAASYFLLIYGVVLFVHILLSFQYIKKYGYLFQSPNGGR